jgi:hypothetical protein
MSSTVPRRNGSPAAGLAAVDLDGVAVVAVEDAGEVDHHRLPLLELGAGALRTRRQRLARRVADVAVADGGRQRVERQETRHLGARQDERLPGAHERFFGFDFFFCSGGV